METSVYVLTYDHRHGNDVYVHRSEAGAYKQACSLILTWIDEVDDAQTREHIVSLCAAEQWEKAHEIWSEWQWEHADVPETLSINQAELRP